MNWYSLFTLLLIRYKISDDIVSKLRFVVTVRPPLRWWLSREWLSGINCPGVDCPRGDCPGLIVRELIVQGVIVRGWLSGGWLSWGDCPATEKAHCQQTNMGLIVILPFLGRSMTSTSQWFSLSRASRKTGKASGLFVSRSQFISARFLRRSVGSVLCICSHFSLVRTRCCIR